MSNTLTTLKALQDTMTKVVADEKQLNIGTWSNKCGTVCCVIGWHVVYTQNPKSYEDIKDASFSFVKDLDSDLFDSVYASYLEHRQDYAKESGLFSAEELDTLPHLNKVEPSAQEALDYINLCIEKLTCGC